MSVTKVGEMSINLFYKAGSSDKVYQCQLTPGDGGWLVNFQYGRRGQTLTSGTKTSKVLTYAKAFAIYEKLINEKKGKGYTEDKSGTVYAGSEKEGEVSGMVPQLLNFISEETALRLLEDDNWMMQEKKDGRRVMCRVTREEVIASNRKGLVISIPKTVEDVLKTMVSKEGELVLDGEMVGDVYYLFDVLSIDGVDSTTTTAEARFTWLQSLIYSWGWVKPVRSEVNTIQKKSLYQSIKQARGEGVVFKKKSSVYKPGRPNSGGDQLKYKFTQSATCRVIKVNSKRSVELGILAEDETGTTVTRYIGKVTIPANHQIPDLGTLCEVRYLYAYPGGSLYQPVYLGPRDDVNDADHVSSLKLKQENEEEDEK